MLHPCYSITESGHLAIGGIDTLSLAREYGTPLYVLDENHIRAMCRLYKDAFAESFGSNSVPAFAGKALCFKGMYKIIAEEGLHADCVSCGEIVTAHATGFPMEKVFFHGNHKEDDELRLAVSMGVGHIVVDSLEEIEALDTICCESGSLQHVLLRVTPEIDPHTHKKIITGNVDSKFGSPISTGAAERLAVAVSSQKHLILDGFHAHIGSQIFDSAPFNEEAGIMISFLSSMRKKLDMDLPILNLGGGFGVRYTEEDPQIDYRANIRMIAENIRKICDCECTPFPQIIMEPGRSIVAAAGITLYSVGSVKEIPGFRNYVSVNGGMPDNPRYALYQSRYTVVNAAHANEKADYVCTIAGRCCESGDLIAEGVSIVKPQRGDILAVLVTGAYNYSMASHYNRVPKPPIVFVRDGKCTVAVRRETYEDLLRFDV